CKNCTARLGAVARARRGAGGDGGLVPGERALVAGHPVGRVPAVVPAQLRRARGAGGRMTALLFGGGGLLGRHLHEELVRRGQTVVAPPRDRCRIEDEVEVRKAVNLSGCSLVVNAAAFTDVDGAEKQPE